MVLQQAHRHSRTASHPSLDFNRIAGISGTLALNVLAFLLLLMPMATAPPSLPVFEEKRNPELVPVVPVKPVTVEQPERVDVVPPQPRPQPVQRTQPIVSPASDPVVVDHGTEQADPVVDTIVGDSTPLDPAPSGPVQGMRLEYARTPPPAYPREALRRELQGVVMLEVLVDVDGKPLKVGIHASSGHRLLDQEAVRHVLRHWTFRPATRDGRAVQAVGLVPIEFRLDRG